MGAVVTRKVVEVGEMNVVAYPLARTRDDCPDTSSSSQSHAGKGGGRHCFLRYSLAFFASPEVTSLDHCCEGGGDS
ncbi:hypothetical protein VPH35_110790 [Triticum aestivum]